MHTPNRPLLPQPSTSGTYSTSTASTMTATNRALFLAVVLLSVPLLASSSLAFLATGDWGGVNVPPYSTPGQRAAAKGMGIVGADINSKFVVAAGDNFYFDGVTDDTSPRFVDTWSSVYSAASLQEPWLVIAGNHDHNGNVSAQIAYTQKDPTKRWTFPAPYHKKVFQGDGDGVTVEIILIDTVDLASKNAVQDTHLEGYFNPLPARPKSAAADAWAWIEASLAASVADYVLVVGHYPVYSVCEHGPTQTLIDHLDPLLQKYGAHYFSGHDHCHEHFSVGKTNYILSGVGDECCYSAENLNNPAIPAGALKYYASKENKPKNLIGGFVSFVATISKGLQIQYHDQDGKALYTAPIVEPRQV